MRTPRKKKVGGWSTWRPDWAIEVYSLEAVGALNGTGPASVIVEADSPDIRRCGFSPAPTTAACGCMRAAAHRRSARWHGDVCAPGQFVDPSRRGHSVTDDDQRLAHGRSVLGA